MNDQTVALAQLDHFLREHLTNRERELPKAAQILRESLHYSLFSGGKRFRPQLCFLAADILDCGHDRVMPFAAALEMIHTYSLIHDDLPAMDNDDFRRDKPTNHRVYGEDIALLSGDALLTESFCVLGQHYSQTPDIAVELICKLSQAAGYTGMIAGQTIDMHFVNEKDMASTATSSAAAPTDSSHKQLIEMHALKTGALIRVALEGVAIISRSNQQERANLIECGQNLGLAFQLADDLLDYDPKQLELSGFPKLVGYETTKQWLNEATEKAIGAIEPFGSRATQLQNLILNNRTRTV